jgi:hypothetical protein
MKLLHLLLAFLSPAALFASNSGYLWLAKSITASIERDDQYLNLGQYLHLTQKLQDGETGWTMSKMDLPEKWKIQNLRIEDDEIRFEVENGLSFFLSRTNTPKLDFALLSLKDSTDEKIEQLWIKHAKRK